MKDKNPKANMLFENTSRETRQKWWWNNNNNTKMLKNPKENIDTKNNK